MKNGETAKGKRETANDDYFACPAAGDHALDERCWQGYNKWLSLGAGDFPPLAGQAPVNRG
jgi:hypothetical protein